MRSSDGTTRSYWVAVLVLLLLGLLTIFSFGIYLWSIALALILLAPFRSRPAVFLPGLALFLGLLAGYVLVAPWGCSVSFTSDPATGDEKRSPVVCTSPIGIEYTGEEPFEPSRVPALITGAVTGVVAAAATVLAVRSRMGRESSSVDGR